MEANQIRSTFRAFILNEPFNRRLLTAAIVLVAIEWIVFKIAYPFPDFFSDSYSYIIAAAENLDINIWPIGYSKFLLIFHHITSSDTALVSFQFFVLELAALYLFLTLIYWFVPGKTIITFLFAFFFCNPLFFYISNYISSDALFAALSLLWFTELIWIVLKPNSGRIWVQTFCVFLAFTFRYNALYYPIVTALAYLLSRQRLYVKWIGIFLIAPLLLAFWIYSRNAGRELIGRPLSTVLGGWQLANNALYMRGEIAVDANTLPTPDSRELDKMSQTFFLKMGPNFKAVLDHHPGNFFIQYWRGPLKTYMLLKYGDPTVRAWGKVSPVYADYGSALILGHPLAYARYYMLMNARNYFLPSLEKLAIYNLGDDSVQQPARVWFHYKTSKIRVCSKDIQGNLLQVFSYFFLAINLFLAGSIIWYFWSGAYKGSLNTLTKVLLLVVGFYGVNFFFSIFANIIVLRYQFFPMVIIASFFALLYERVDVNQWTNAPAFNIQTPRKVT